MISLRRIKAALAELCSLTKPRCQSLAYRDRELVQCTEPADHSPCTPHTAPSPAGGLTLPWTDP